MANKAIIDLGSNTIRLCVYEINPKKTGSKQFKTLLNQKKMVGLSAFVQDGMMTQQGIDRAVEVIGAHIKRANVLGCDTPAIFATAVLRNCINSREATEVITQACGFKIDLLSNFDEAHLGFVGANCQNLLQNGIMVDIGGGSTELTRIENSTDHDNISIPQGSLSSFSKHVHAILPTDEEADDIASSFLTYLDEAGNGVEYRSAQLYGIGGSIRAAAKVYAELFNDGVRRKHLMSEDVDAIIDAYRRDADTFSHKALRASADRIHTIIPGCIILQQVFRRTGAARLDISKYGLREGYLLERVLGE